MYTNKVFDQLSLLKILHLFIGQCVLGGGQLLGGDPDQRVWVRLGDGLDMLQSLIPQVQAPLDSIGICLALSYDL